MSPGLGITIGAAAYEQLDAIADGRVRVAGASAHLETERVVTRIFERMIVGREFDVAELGWTYYLRTLDLDDPAFLAIPVFPNRQFRHSAIYVNADSGIETPEDLAGRTIGEFALYGHDAGFWPKGILADDVGFDPRECRWVVGGLDWPMDPVDFVPAIHPPGVDVTQSPPGTDLGALLEAGEIDALISADVPRCVLDGSPRVRRLFRDSRAVERDYFARTGIFPMMHTMVVRREVARAHPWLCRAVYDAMCASTEAAAERYRVGRIFNTMTTMVPWLGELLDDNAATLGPHPYAHGIEANRDALTTLLGYHHEQGLSRRLLSIEDVFEPSLLDT